MSHQSKILHFLIFIILIEMSVTRKVFYVKARGILPVPHICSVGSPILAQGVPYPEGYPYPDQEGAPILAGGYLLLTGRGHTPSDRTMGTPLRERTDTRLSSCILWNAAVITDIVSRKV